MIGKAAAALAVCCMSLPGAAAGQVVTGRVIDSTSQQPVANVNITVEGTTSG